MANKDDTNNKKKFLEALVNKKRDLKEPIEKNKNNNDDTVINDILLKVTSTIENTKKVKEKVKVLLNYDIEKGLETLQNKILQQKPIIRKKILERYKKAMPKIFSKEYATYQSVMTSINTKIEQVTTFVGKIKDFTLDTIDVIWTSLKDIGKKVYSVLSEIADFLLKPFKAGWGIIDNFLMRFTPTIWSGIKQVASTAFSIVSWLWNFGTKMLEYVWEGVKTIFKYGYDVMMLVGKTVMKGVSFVFSLWIRTLINTLFNPAMIIINLPILLILTGAFLTALGTVIGIVFDIGSGLLRGAINIGEKVIDWVWSGIETLFTWVQKIYEGSWLQKFINDIIVDGIFNWVMSFDTIKKFVSYVKIGYSWIQKNGKFIINNAIKWGKKIYEFVKEKPVTSFVVNLLNYINSKIVLRNFASPLVHFLIEKFGYMPGIDYSNTDIRPPEMNIKNVEDFANAQKKEHLKTLLEYYAVGSAKQGIDNKNIEAFLRKSVLPSFGKEVYAADFSKEELDSIIGTTVVKAKNILSKKDGAIPNYDDLLSNQIKSIRDLEDARSKMLNGYLDPTSDAHNKFLTNLKANAIKNKNQFLDRSNKNIELPATFKNIDSIKEQLDDVVYQNTMKSKIGDVEKIEKLLKTAKTEEVWGRASISAAADNFLRSDIPWYENIASGSYTTLKSGINFFANQSSKLALHALTGAEQTYYLLQDSITDPLSPIALRDVAREGSGYLSSTVIDKARDVFGTGGVEFFKDNVTEKEKLEAAMLNVDTEKRANGGLKSLEFDKLHDLNEYATKYVKQKVESIQSKALKTEETHKNKNKNNITIIENITIAQEDMSYETYTISQLSRGLLAGG